MNKKRLLEFKNRDNYIRHLTTLLDLQCRQFVYTGLPETVPAEFLEFYLTINGTVALGHVKELHNKDVYCATGGYNGDYNGYMPKEYTAAVTGLGEISGAWYGDNKTIVVGLNNFSRSPDFDIPHTAEVLSQIDISERCNVIFARMARMPYANNDKQRAAIESAVQSIIKGDPFATFTQDAVDKFEQFLESSNYQDKEKFLDLVDPDKINGLQYLNQYRDNVMKRWLARRGYMIQTTSKLAQQTDSEIHGSDSYAMLYPLEQLECRKKMCEELSEVLDTECSVDFNPILRKVYDDYMTEPEEQQTQSDSESESESESEPDHTEEVDDNDTDS